MLNILVTAADWSGRPTGQSVGYLVDYLEKAGRCALLA